ncbi:malate dehydrogenase (oxaloacetate-decarboxylating)(NADP+) [Dyadobacter sp. BE34]|uniref:Malate dehydrogenase (Oxaloacetate-decarboxylating)(NADP+) n=1 Tax=Dyadobacter fermentans TaxID=94254 RepID=A0ABU1QYL2_9BACT|nr:MULTISPECIES: NADP-dependent malic enzyme [Dyadobacter]MDR6806220.1 malate dehydrogenase (oxaloacetate-decarboxylating)(NADP+) [Dyadobacter fermentans]MDR7043961.1 malate dehydrogenase (oxaloacetate-decarboxylating)(NADP+) [Dyadobacter sp. BE242]MDR7198272.1 malate dehydrogenase (oxaloacetate-decarboxylating)(NADP+) [Dyadobacter sp. BE34]MDR7216235.1 malate dehydrogenase (oxaloacetate-decarboxylating)(NADP+) [Dyadobacter sp. BE31]MDR7264239.1 malate dehydrogenase (oxaloacetate-decarboxylati
MNKKIRKEDALYYHSKGRPGKIQVIPTKETSTQRDLSLAYSPGVAEPCLEIADNVENAYQYTAKGNLVAVISNGTAVLGLGDIGPEASKPVMEGKGLLFKIYADIDVFDIELNTKDVDEFVRTVKILEPTFGGVNLEDIKAPECFDIEARLKKELNIPVMHDDQHGTAIISAAAMLNALVLVDKKIEDIRVVVSGAGASAVSCTKLYLALGASPKNIAMFDTKGHIHNGRTDLSDMKKQFATDKAYGSLEEAMVGADLFLGLSTADIVSKEMVKSMAKDPIVLAMANPNPEIPYPDAVAAREDVIMATGRSDYPNQVNNVLGFPYIFRGALDVRATEINEEMKLAAVHALADLAKKPVPDIVNLAYNETNIVFGKNYIIPKPVDPRLLTTVAPAVAKAAIETGVARKVITDWDAYEQELSSRLGRNEQISRVILNKAKLAPKKVVFADAENIQVLRAAQQVRDEGIATPILLGNKETIQHLIRESKLDLADVSIIDPRAPESDPMIEKYAAKLFEKRQRKGLTPIEARRTMYFKSYFGSMMVETGEADAFISGLTRTYPDTIRPALQVIGKQEGVNKVAGMYILLTPKGPLFFSDTTVNLDPTVDDIVEITELTAKAVERFNIQPRIALVTYANYGSAKGADAEKMRDATAILKKRNPSMIVEGELQAHLAFNTTLLKENHPFSDLVDGGANTLIFPNLSASNIAYNLLKEAAELETIGPILLGLKKPVHVLQLGSSVREIVNMVAIAVVEAQMKGK